MVSRQPETAPVNVRGEYYSLKIIFRVYFSALVHLPKQPLLPSHEHAGRLCVVVVEK